MSQLIITVGAPGAGKSTWAEENLPKDCLRLERDRVREAFWGSRAAYHADPLQQKRKSFLLGRVMFDTAMMWPYNRPIALTDTGIYYNSVERFLHLRPRLRIVVFDTPPSVLHERNQTRPEGHRVPESFLNKCIADMSASVAWWRKHNHEVISCEPLSSSSSFS